MVDLITEDLVRLDATWGGDKADVVRGLAALLETSGRTGDVDGIVADVLAREATSPTGLPGGIALPHSRTSGVTEPALVFARLSPKVPFGAGDGPADLAFLILAPEGGDAVHLTLLSLITRALARPSFVNALRGADTSAEALATISKALGAAWSSPRPTSSDHTA